MPSTAQFVLPSALAGATDLIGVLSQAEAEHAGDDHLVVTAPRVFRSRDRNPRRICLSAARSAAAPARLISSSSSPKF